MLLFFRLSRKRQTMLRYAEKASVVSHQSCDKELWEEHQWETRRINESINENG